MISAARSMKAECRISTSGRARPVSRCDRPSGAVLRLVFVQNRSMWAYMSCDACVEHSTTSVTPRLKRAKTRSAASVERPGAPTAAIVASSRTVLRGAGSRTTRSSSCGRKSCARWRGTHRRDRRPPRADLAARARRARAVRDRERLDAHAVADGEIAAGLEQDAPVDQRLPIDHASRKQGVAGRLGQQDRGASHARAGEPAAVVAVRMRQQDESGLGRLREPSRQPRVRTQAAASRLS